MRSGFATFAGLAALTAIEYVIAVTVDRALLPLIPIAAVKGWLILDRFMHIRQLRHKVEV